ncbi:MAG TPA: hypothetical protein VLF59_01690 [Candidatus Saccharimonadales bacterium]|nr:hypothetical protein [Candidatus Saccharimonadales bacterium]
MPRDRFQNAVDAYVQDKLWYWYIPLWLFGIYIFIKLLGFDMLTNLPFVLLVPYSFDFMLHEISHIVTAFFPPVLTASAGSVSELLLGSGLVVGAFYWRNYFASMFCLLWFDLTCQSAGTYMADAIPQRLPLVSLGGALSGQDSIHDWHFVFGKLHMLGMSSFIGNSIRVIGHLAGLCGVAFATWLIYKMAAAASVPKAEKNLAAAMSNPEHVVAAPVALRGSKPIYPEPTRGTLAPHHDPTLDNPHQPAAANKEP